MSELSVLETDWWTIVVPPHWWAEHDDEGVVAIGDEDGVGAIEISTLQRDGEAGAEALDLAALAAEESPEVVAWEPAQCGEFSGLRGQFSEEGTALREWYLQAGALLLYVTYACEQENAGMDDAAVDEILDTLQPIA
jgi:hypothetical protein